MSQKFAGSTHDKLQQHVAPIHEELGRVAVEMEKLSAGGGQSGMEMAKLRGERAILHGLAVDGLDKVGISKEAVSQLAAACW